MHRAMILTMLHNRPFQPLCVLRRNGQRLDVLDADNARQMGDTLIVRVADCDREEGECLVLLGADEVVALEVLQSKRVGAS